MEENRKKKDREIISKGKEEKWQRLIKAAYQITKRTVWP